MVLRLANFHAYGPTLYECNHPLDARVAFTPVVLLHCTPLSEVLCDLIGTYAPLALPSIVDDVAIAEDRQSVDDRRSAWLEFIASREPLHGYAHGSTH
jgi:hypothetical protein